MTQQLLGGLSARTFLRRHWQKRPLLVRGALADAKPLVDVRALKALAARDDVESRMVERRGARWNTTHGPFASPRFSKTNHALLVSGVNLHVPAADALLRRFSFIPSARLDDVMVSYATPGGGVGPHVDSYDVFLVQGPGRRRWTLWLADGRKVEHVVEPGDLLYLPPGLRHDGVALEPCFTYSVGFRAPRGAELGAAFLDWLHERGLPDARYADPGLAPTRFPARIPDALLRFCLGVLGRISWQRRDVGDFLGRYLTEPKPHVVFRPSRRRRGSIVALDARTQLLYLGDRFFINGERVVARGAAARALRELADRRKARLAALAGSGNRALISAWLRSGYVRLQGVQS